MLLKGAMPWMLEINITVSFFNIVWVTSDSHRLEVETVAIYLHFFHHEYFQENQHTKILFASTKSFTTSAICLSLVGCGAIPLPPNDGGAIVQWLWLQIIEIEENFQQSEQHA